MDFLAAKLDRLQSRVDQHFNHRVCGGREAKVVGGRHAVDDHARVIAAGHGTDDGHRLF
ncbi:hypothetical protein [Mesorhizobium sp.]|uniref:hypothetical protein n=1 Tax=Mesorhizobium sp. TaxID=1871066 RepID=UPI0025E19DBA|nr:hypothetical protein [Mesorhizobium sp.]